MQAESGEPEVNFLYLFIAGIVGLHLLALVNSYYNIACKFPSLINLFLGLLVLRNDRRNRKTKTQRSLK